MWRKLFPVRRLLFLGTNEESLISEYLNIICRPDEGELVTRSILQFIVQEDLCDDLSLRTMESATQTTLHFKQMAKSQGFFTRVSHAGKSPYIQLPNKYHDFMSQCSPSMRYNIRRQKRKLVRYDAHFRKTETSSQLENDFPEFIRLHQLRWESREMPGSFAGGQFPLFQKRIMQEMLVKGYLELRFLSFSGKNVAVLYNICYRGKIYYYQSGLDISFDKTLSLGLLLHDHAIQDAIERSLYEYDFLLAGKMDDYKFRWTKESRDFCDIYMTRSRTIKMSVLIKNNARTLYTLMKSVRSLARFSKTHTSFDSRLGV